MSGLYRDAGTIVFIFHWFEEEGRIRLRRLHELINWIRVVTARKLLSRPPHRE